MRHRRYIPYAERAAIRSRRAQRAHAFHLVTLALLYALAAVALAGFITAAAITIETAAALAHPAACHSNPCQE